MSTSDIPTTSDDLITKAEAARLRGVSRQAIHNLVVREKLKTKCIGGRDFVFKSEVLACVAEDVKKGESSDQTIINGLLEEFEKTPKHLWPAIREAISLRAPHSLERQLGVNAELILTSVQKAGDITLRGLRGIITEEAFRRFVLLPLINEDPTRWSQEEEYDPNSNPAYDATLISGGIKARIQVKMQRSEKHVALSTNPNGKNGILPGYWIAETQKTRNAKDGDDGGNVDPAEEHAETVVAESVTESDPEGKKKKPNTRPYRFGEFDILAISLQPSQKKWDQFIYTLSDWLIPRENNSNLMRVYQPVPFKPVAGEWTDDLEEAFEWLVANADNRKKKISGMKPEKPHKDKRQGK